jgi:hypothetical protein
MNSTRLVLIIIVMLMLGGAGTWGAIADDPGVSRNGRADSSGSARQRRTTDAMPGPGGSGRMANAQTTAPTESDSGKPEDSGSRPDAKPAGDPDRGSPDGDGHDIRSKIRKGIGDAVDSVKEPEDVPTPVTVVSSASAESVVKGEDAGTAGGAMVTSMGISRRGCGG